MPNLLKAKHKAGFDNISLEFLGKLHRYYYDGLAAAEPGLSEFERVEGYAFLEKLEGLLVQSGYFQQFEIDLRHKEKQQAAKPKILDPYSNIIQ